MSEIIEVSLTEETHARLILLREKLRVESKADAVAKAIEIASIVVDNIVDGKRVVLIKGSANIVTSDGENVQMLIISGLK